MRRGECHELEVLIDREAHGWSEAERLRVEQHLTSCAGCREALAASRFVRATLRTAQGGLSEVARERALKGAFAAAATAPVRKSVGPRRSWLGAFGALSAAAALLFWWSAGKQDPHAPQALRQSPALPAADRFVSTEPPAPEQTPPQPDSVQQVLAAPVWIEAAAKQRHQFGHASVQLARATRARFEQASSTLVLASGRVEVDVDARRGQPFRVTTQHFRVEVLGTRFAVTPRSVVVMRGHVQIFAPDGRVLASDVAAGGTFTLDARGSVQAQHEQGQLAPGPAESASSWLARARQVLAQGDRQRTLELVGRAEASTPGRAERAEAGTLRAEAALLGKQYAEAIALYGRVADHFSDLPAGENAAFAAAQLASRSLPARARALLERYLALYPQGRFVDEAKRRLARLAEH